MREDKQLEHLELCISVKIQSSLRDSSEAMKSSGRSDEKCSRSEVIGWIKPSVFACSAGLCKFLKTACTTTCLHRGGQSSKHSNLGLPIVAVCT